MLPVGIFGRIVFDGGIGDLGTGDALQGERDAADKLAEAERFVLIDCQRKRISVNGAGMGLQHSHKLGKNVGKIRPEVGRREVGNIAEINHQPDHGNRCEKVFAIKRRSTDDLQ